jgi:aspartyl-tRNA(Asn)/glutamyl-tRNA(Gln) amidotransferase subunit B
MTAQWETVIGLESHVQLLTKSKIFSPASTAFGAPPNAQANAIDLALPGVLPVLNRAAVECAIRFGCAVGAQIAERSVFARKNYFYPDLPKGYQISQYELPVVQGGTVSCLVSPRPGEPYAKTVRLTRAHLEEDAGKSLHEAFADQTGIDLNRAGTPLLEIVSEPDMRSSAEAVAYARALHALVVWLDICDGNMQEGSFRCDANVSVRPAGDARLGTRVEIKNLNSFRFLQQAIEHEIRRQIEHIEEGGQVVQETRLYDPNLDQTRSMRSKEDAMDYRYFPDPDLLPLQVPAEWVQRVRKALPELPEAMRARLVSHYGLSSYDAAVLTSSRPLAQYFESAAQGAPDPKAVANWVNGEVSAALHAAGLSIEQCPVAPAQLAALLSRIGDGTINQKIAKDVFAALWEGKAESVDAYIDAHGLRQISDAGAIEAIVDQVLAANPAMIAEFKSGKEKAFNALVGQTMKATGGKANPAQVTGILRRKLGG